MPTPLITATELDQLRAAGKPRVVVFDCSFDLTNPAAGRDSYQQGHIPGAYYLHLDNELSGPKTGLSGRHPLPDAELFAARLRVLGVDDDTLVVAYDGQGSMYAARLWWMLRWIGHAAALVLDGGRNAWVAAGLPLEHGATAEPEIGGNLMRRASLVKTVDADALVANLSQPSLLVVDARAADRFRGENETLDPVGGHIPGAANRFFKDNLTADGYFKPADQLRADFGQVFAGKAPAQTVMQCGSGVTACHNLLALEVAGLTGAALYPGSWSEWCADPKRPVATGS
ncbi:thiosulfate/3-mercaptopyruvate sulfurtransferase [Cupriavidus metallidurans]|jgi:thiosulfate/3-mercaptopyruvate sulfurtransferase|uniref:sulfurtransferase n=1 Tax=Cupriavidus TaxID=106589 RepID=UPI0004932794|nr:sulfurtransferase [Cupriavidus metallidurans]AVA36678.1 sulfurtransferase [Cupriavidus metallidurans]KWW37338.1 putative thiosulfate sulfurtransferase SseB [Cupriavidus metallidurans]MDE4919007.1 sulfurtransferase [Cupriavidus metallidurans]